MSHSAPLSNRDFDFFYEGLEQEKLLIQRCEACSALRTPPGPACYECGSTAWTSIAARGTGLLFSYTVHHHPPLPGFETPHPIGLIELDEGVRVLGAMEPVPLDRIRIGMPLEIEFCRRGDIAGFRFRERQTAGAGA
jgi:uncharacterized OB-fold protein